jgi:uncharacterized protein
MAVPADTSLNAAARQSACGADESARASSRSNKGARCGEAVRWALKRRNTLDKDRPGKYRYLSGMRFTQDSTSGVNLIRAYRAGEIRINETAYHEALILSASAIIKEPTLQRVSELGAEHRMRILSLEPELVLLGTGQHQTFPDVSFGAEFLRLRIGFEVMDTGAACRTFNVLVAEQRRVVAVLLM